MGQTGATYIDCLKQIDLEWRARREYMPQFGVFGPRPSWQDTISRAQVIFDVHDWTTLDQDMCALIAPIHKFESGDALLGSIGRRSPAVRAFLFNPAHAEDRNRVLDRLKSVRTASGRELTLVAGALLIELCSVRGLQTAFASRLLALARPDWFVVVNNKARKWLTEVTGIGLRGKKRSYQQLITWVSEQDWHASPEPSDVWERSIWRMRAALLDAFAYAYCPGR